MSHWCRVLYPVQTVMVLLQGLPRKRMNHQRRGRNGERTTEKYDVWGVLHHFVEGLDSHKKGASKRAHQLNPQLVRPPEARCPPEGNHHRHQRECLQEEKKLLKKVSSVRLVVKSLVLRCRSVCVPRSTFTTRKSKWNYGRWTQKLCLRSSNNVQLRAWLKKTRLCTNYIQEKKQKLENVFWHI